MDKSKVIKKIKSAIDNQYYVSFDVKDSISRLAKKNNILIVALIHSGMVELHGISFKRIGIVKYQEGLEEKDLKFLLIQNYDTDDIEAHRFLDDISDSSNRWRFSHDIKVCLEFNLSYLKEEDSQVYKLELMDHYEYDFIYETFSIKGEDWNGTHCNGFIIDMDPIKKPEINLYHLLFNIRYLLSSYDTGKNHLNCKIDESNNIFFDLKVSTIIRDKTFFIKIGRINKELSIGVREEFTSKGYILKNIKSIDCIFNIIFILIHYALTDELKEKLNFKICTETEKDWI